MTSSGQVTIPEATPADAPQNPLIVELERPAQKTARLEKGELKLDLCFEVSWDDTLAVVGAYRCEGGLGDGGDCGASVDMVKVSVVPFKVPQCAESPAALQ